MALLYQRNLNEFVNDYFLFSFFLSAEMLFFQKPKPRAI